MSTGTGLDRALLAEVCTKADLVWVQVDGQAARGMWHVWDAGAVTLVTGGLEQPNPGLLDGESVLLIVRSKDKATRVLTVAATARLLDSSSDAWDQAVGALHPKRLNPPDGEAQPSRWRSDSDVWRLEPKGEALEGPGNMSTESGRAAPQPTVATTSMRRPFHAGRATKRRR